MKKTVEIELNNLINECNFDNVETIEWWYVCRYGKLSENLMREFKDKLDWNEIAAHQKLSENFIREFRNKLNPDLLLFYLKIDRDFYDELIKPYSAPKFKSRYDIMDFND